MGLSYHWTALCKSTPFWGLTSPRYVPKEDERGSIGQETVQRARLRYDRTTLNVSCNSVALEQEKSGENQVDQIKDQLDTSL